MTDHAIKFRVHDLRFGGATYDHRPPGGAGYKFVMPDGGPVTDADIAEAHNCRVCYPTFASRLIDRGPAS